METRKKGIGASKEAEQSRESKTKKTMKEETSISAAAESITIHAFPRIFSSKSVVVKTFWCLAFLGALGVLIWFISQGVIDFGKHDVYIKSVSRVLQPLPFPAITVCNSDRFSGSPMQAFSMHGMSCNDTTNDNASLSRQEVEFKKACKLFMSGAKDTFRFGGKELPGFPQSFMSSNGLYPCFTFNKNGQTKQNIGGGGKGLDMMFFMDDADAVEASIANLSRFDDQRRGIMIQVHDPKTEVSLDQSSSIFLMPGYSTEIILKRETITRKKAPFPSKCHTSETTNYKLIETRYTRSNCLASCFLLKLQARCGNITSVNKSVSQLRCEADLYKRQPVDDCICPQPCFEISYPKQISINVWPRKFQIESMKDEFAKIANVSSDAITVEYMQKRFAKVKIFYQEVINTDISEEELYGITNLLSEIGGLMGLFIGSSILSLVEVFWLTCLLGKNIFRKICSRSSQKIERITTAEMGVNNRSDQLVNMTKFIDYKELVDSPSLSHDRRKEHDV